MKKHLTILFLSFLSFNSSTQEIAQWRGSQRNGIYLEKGLLRKWPEPSPQLLWSYDGLGEGYGSASVTSQGVFAAGMENGTGYVFSFNHQGKLLWKKEYGREWNESHSGTRATPLVVGDKLYLISAYGKLVCMNSANGNILWQIDFPKVHDAGIPDWGINENLLADGDVLYCTPGGKDANLVALNRNTGSIIWKSKGNGEKSAYCSPLMLNLPGKKLLVTMMERSIQGFDAANGKLLWRFGYANQYSVHPNTPVYINGYLYCTSGYGYGGVMLKLSADGSSVTQVWKNDKPDPKTGGFVVINGRIYCGGDNNRQLFCVDWNTGKILYQLNRLAPCNIIANDGLLYIYTERGEVALVEPASDSFNIISTFRVPKGSGPHWAHLVIHNKRLYVRHGSSLMVYDIGAKN